jgi:hypothetical protein
MVEEAEEAEVERGRARLWLQLQQWRSCSMLVPLGTPATQKWEEVN